MSIVIRAIAETDDTITFSKAEWSAFIEDAHDLASVETALALRATLGEAEFDRFCYTAAEVARMLDDDVSPVTIWRQRNGLTQRDLAGQAGVSATYLNEIESGRKPGSLAAIKAVATVLRVPMEQLVSLTRSQPRNPPLPGASGRRKKR